MSQKFENVIINSQKSRVEIDGGKMVITPDKGKTVTIEKGEIDHADWSQISRDFYCLYLMVGERFYSISKFQIGDKSKLFAALKNQLDVEANEEDLSISGLNEGVFFHDKHTFGIKDDGKPVIKVPYKTISNVQSSKNDFFVQILQEGRIEGHQLENVRIFVPQNGAEKVQDIVANIRGYMKQHTASENYFAQINDLTLKQPSGNADFRYCEDNLFIQFQEVNFQIKYSNIRLIHRFSIPDSKNEYVLITLSHPFRRGRTDYDNIVVQTSDDEVAKILNIPDSTMKESEAIVKFFEQYANKKEVEHDNFFLSSDGTNAIFGSWKGNQNYLFITNSHFVILPKSKVIPFDAVRHVEFTRIDADTMRNNKFFDLAITETGSNKPIDFMNIPHKEFVLLLNFFKKAGLTIHNYNLAEDFATIISRDRGEGRGSRLAADIKIREEAKEMNKISDSDEEEDEDFNPDKKESSSDNEEEEVAAEKSDDDEAPAEEPAESE